MAPLPTLEDQVRALATRLDAMESRLARLEGHEAPAEPSEPLEAIALPSALRVDGRRLVPALGRSFIILGGAFLLRALTDAGVWPPAVGVGVGLLYGLAWMGTAVVAGGQGDRVRPLFDGATALVIGFPLIVEATFKFGLLGAQSAALALSLVSAGALGVAATVRSQPLAWLASLGGMATGLMLMVRLGVMAPYALYFTALGVAALWLGYVCEWRLIRWPTGLLAALVVFGVTTRAIGTPPLDEPAVAWLVQAMLVLGYFSSIAVRTLVRGRRVIVFEVVQTLVVLLVGVGGALAVSRSAGAGELVLGLALVALGTAAYLVAFAFMPRDSAGALNFYFYSSLALGFVLTGLGVATSGTVRALVLTLLAALLGIAWRRSGRVSLGGHAAVALVAASVSGGLLALAESAFVGPLPATAVAGPAALTLIVALVISGSRMASCHLPRPLGSDIPAMAVGVVVLAGVAGLVTLAIGRGTGWHADPGVLATVRTALLSALAVAAAWLHRPGAFSAIGTLAYPLLAAIGLKLMVSDLRVSTAATLFVALACYGVALVLVPRMHRAA